MRILLSWLAEFTEVPDNPQTFADRITDIGLEVEEIIRPDREISDVRVARVLETKTHPDNPELTICELESDGTHGQVVTAAPAVKNDTNYLWAIPGSTLPGQRVERRDFQGIDSEGMLVSSRELGLTRDVQTLFPIPDQYETGTDAIDVLDLSDPILEIDLTPNRPDCLSHLGVARDYAAAENLELKDPRPEALPDGPDTDVEIHIEAGEDCWSYTGVPVGGVNVTTSSFPIQKRLLKMGLRPLNNLVDITNYVLFEIGHPLHPFDYDRIVSPVTIRRAEEEEIIRTLDGETHELSDQDLVIADKHGPQALAGIMGGANAQVEQRTERILLEGAYFNPTTIRRTAGRLKLHTEASHRFERGTDPVEYHRSIARCLELFADDPAQGDEFTVFDPIVAKTHEPETTTISFSASRFPERIGFDPGEEKMKTQLQRLGLTIDEGDRNWKLTVPSWRPDLSRPDDILEEIVRLHGYEKIPVSFPGLPIDQTVVPEHSLVDTLRDFLSARGLHEAVTYSFVGEDEHLFSENGLETPLGLENPLSRHTKTLRTDILTSLVNTFEDNRERIIHGFFEIGPIFPPDSEEETVLGLVIGGERDPRRWDEAGMLDFFDIRGLLEALLSRIGVHTLKFKQDDREGFHELRCASIVKNDATIGWFGEIDESRLSGERDYPLFGLQLSLGELSLQRSDSYQPYSTQPEVKRDLDLVVDQDQFVQPLINTIEQEGEWLEDIRIFDLYNGEPLPTDKKSVSLSMTFRHPENTLDDETINEIQNRIFEALQDEYGVTLRSE